MRLVVGVTGASGAIYAKRLLEVLKEKNVEVDLIVTAPAEYIIQNELRLTSNELGELATATWDISDIAADVAHGDTALHDGCRGEDGTWHLGQSAFTLL